MSHVARRWACLLGLVWLAGCATPAIVFDPANLARVQHLGVLTPGFPDRPTVAVLPPTYGAAFLLANSIQEGNRSREFADVVARADIHPEQEFTTALLACLRKAGLQPSPLPADPHRTALLKEYGAVGDPGIGGILDVVVTRYGYYAVTNAAPFKPSVTMQVRLVEAHSHSVMMQDKIDMVNIPPSSPGSAGGSYQDYSDIAADPSGAVAALKSAIGSAADAVCQRFS